VSGLDDTDSCPVAASCEGCGSTWRLSVVTAQTSVGVHCVTWCGVCAENGRLPAVGSWVQAIERSGAHAVHLGIDVDQMAEMMAEEG
jgi:hypothetical protein